MESGMECTIYKGNRKPEHYLFLPAELSIEEIPADISSMFGQLEQVMTITINPDTKLALSNPEQVLAIIQEKGFYIQMPPQDDIYRLPE